MYSSRWSIGEYIEIQDWYQIMELFFPKRWQYLGNNGFIVVSVSASQYK